MKIKDIGIYASLGALFIGAIGSFAIAKNTIDESKEKITKLEQAVVDYKTEQAVIKEQTTNLKESVDELKQDIKDNQKQLLDAIQKKR